VSESWDDHMKDERWSTQSQAQGGGPSAESDSESDGDRGSGYEDSGDGEPMAEREVAGGDGAEIGQGEPNTFEPEEDPDAAEPPD
jgi:hypothetical protein